MCYNDGAKAQGMLQASNMTDREPDNSRIDVTTVENGFVVSHTGHKDGRYFHKQYCALIPSSVAEIVMTLIR